MSDLSRVRRLVHIVITIIVVSGSLASATGVAVATGTYEPNDDFDTAKSITAGFSGSTSVGPGDRDFYAIELEEGETIDVTVRNAKDAASEVDVRLYGPTGYIKDDGEDLSTQISDETRYRLGYQAQQTGTYYIDVRGLGVSDDPATDYTMNVEIATNDRFEPNGITEQATEITTGNYQNLSLLSGETDYYAVTLAAGETINVTVRNDKAAAFDPNVELFDSSGNRLDRAEDLGTVVADRTRYRIGYQADTNGTYYIEVRGESSIQSSVGYTMNVEVATNDRFEPNGITEQATEITTGNYQNLSLLSGETDYYAVTLAAGETINVTVRNDKAAAFDPNVELFDSSGNRLDRAEDLGTVVADRTRYRIGYQADTNGTYYIEVRGESSIQSSVGYTMNVEVATNDRFEPNGITEQATEITTGNYQNLSLLSGETDYYAVTLAAGETINVTVRNDKAAAFDPNVELFDSSGNRLDRAEDLGTVVADRTRYRIGYQADTNGTYYIEVRGESFIQSSVGYTMNVEVATNDRFEPNGITEQATEITTGNYQNLSLLSGETDYYAVTLAAGETINVTVRNDKAAAFDPNVELFDSSGNRLDRAEDLGTVVADRTRYRIGYQADTNGTYYIEVRGESFIQSSVGYTMNVEVATNDRFEPNGVLTKAAPIGPDSYDNLQILSEESDYFAIRVSAGERLNVTAQYSKDYDLNLEVVNSEGQTLATGSDISDEITERAKLRLSYSPDATKKYYIHVKGEFGAGESTIPYTLSVAGGQEPNIAAPAAEYSYSPATPTPNEQIRFNASASTDPDGTIVSYAWDFESDGTTDATGITATHSYATAGEYAVKLTVTDTSGTASTVTESLTVTTRTLDPLTISLTPQSATPGESVTVTVTAPDGGPVTGATITNARLGVESVSDSDGQAVIDIPSTAPGTYAVNVSAGGYAATSRVLNVTGSDSSQSQPTETDLVAEYAGEDDTVGPFDVITAIDDFRQQQLGPFEVLEIIQAFRN